jgi:peroxiredoxin
MKTMCLLKTAALSAAVVIGAALSAVALAGGEGKDHKHADQAEKTKTEAMAKVGSAAPDFTLKDTEGKEVTLSSFKGKIVVLEWYNSGCPFVKRHHEQNKTMADTAKQFGDKVVWLAINSGAPGKEGHGKDAESKKNWNIAWPILNDETGKVGRLYGAKTTPHMFVIDGQGILRYAGAIDNDPKAEKASGEKVNYVAQAVTELLANKPVSQAETKPYGCSVKYGS